MALVTKNIDNIKEYSLTNDTGDDKTIFVLGMFNSRIASKIQHALRNDYRKLEKTDAIDMTDVIFDTVKFGLKDIKNLKDSSGNEIKIQFEEKQILGIGKCSIVSEDFINKYLKIDWLIELHNELYKMNFMSEQDSKNLQ